MPEEQNQDELQLLRQAQKGDAEAFGVLYEIHAPGVFRYLFSHLEDRLDAEDLTGEVFLRAWRALPGFHWRGIPLRAYLFRVAHNALMDHYRSRRQQPALDLEDERVQDSLPDPSQALHLHLERKEIRRLLEGLRTDYRTVLDLRFIAGLSPDETAQVMGRSAGAVRVLQHRALEALRKIVDDSVQEP